MVDLRQSFRALRGREHDPAGERDDVSVLVRLLTENDIPWLNYLCKKRYSNRYDAATTENWFRNIVLKSPLTFYATRSGDAFQISMLSVLPWLPAEAECSVVFACADTNHGWQIVKLLRDSLEWARNRKCSCWRLSSDTDYDFQPLAKRLGATELSPRFMIRF